MLERVDSTRQPPSSTRRPPTPGALVTDSAAAALEAWNDSLAWFKKYLV